MPFALPDNAAAARLGQAFRALSLSEETVLRTLGVQDSAQARALPPQQRLSRTGGGTPVETVVRLFMLGVPATADQVNAAALGLTADEFQAAGILRPEGGQLRANMQIFPDGETLLLADMPQMVGNRLTAPHDMVPGPFDATRALADVVIRRPGGTMLDLYCGCGMLAIRAAAHCSQVVAADSNPRAVEFTRFNAALNGIKNITTVQSDKFSAFAGKTFDSIVANPPAVISPEKTFSYRDSGQQLDTLVRTVAQQAASHLAPGGFFQMLAHWAHLQIGNPWQRLAEWFVGLGTQAVIHRTGEIAPPQYAMNWIRATSYESNQQAAEKRARDWLAYYQQQGIIAINTGFITLHKPTAADAPVAGAIPADGRPPWLHIEDIREPLMGPAGDQLARGVANREYLRTATPDSIYDTVLVPAPELRLVHEAVHTPEGWRAVAFAIRLGQGFTRGGPVDSWVPAMIGAMNGKATLGDCVRKVCQDANRPETELKPAATEAARRLLEFGALQRA